MTQISMEQLSNEVMTKGYSFTHAIQDKNSITYVFRKKDREVNILDVSSIGRDDNGVCLGIFYMKHAGGHKILSRPLSEGPVIATWTVNGVVVDEVFSGASLSAPRGKIKSLAALQVLEACTASASIPEVNIKAGPTNTIVNILCSLNQIEEVVKNTGLVWPKNAETAKNLIKSGKVRINNEICTDIYCWMSQPATYWLHVEDLYLLKITE